MRMKPVFYVIAAMLVAYAGASWYIGYANRTHPAPWPMFMGDSGRRNLTPAVFPAKPKILWTYSLEDDRAGAPVAWVDGTVYVPLGSGVTAVGSDGKRRWTWRSSVPVYSLALGRQGEIYALSEKTVYALGRDGALLWESAIETGPSAHLLVGQGGAIYVQTRGYLYRLTDTGVAKWRFKLDHPAGTPAETESGLILTQDGPKLYAIKPSGDLAWLQEVGPPQSAGSIMVGVDGNIYVRGRDLLVLNERGERFRDQQSERPTGNLASGRGFVQDGLTRYDSAGTELWHVEGNAQAGFTWATVDSAGGLLLLQEPTQRRSPVPGLTLFDAGGKEVWKLDQVAPRTLPAFTADGRICLAGVRADQQGEAGLICIGNE
jgi:hypothetical protein